MFNRDSNSSGNKNSSLISQSARQGVLNIVNKPSSAPQNNSSSSSSSSQASSARNFSEGLRRGESYNSPESRSSSLISQEAKKSALDIFNKPSIVPQHNQSYSSSSSQISNSGNFSEKNKMNTMLEDIKSRPVTQPNSDSKKSSVLDKYPTIRAAVEGKKLDENLTTNNTQNDQVQRPIKEDTQKISKGNTSSEVEPPSGSAKDAPGDSSTKDTGSKTTSSPPKSSKEAHEKSDEKDTNNEKESSTKGSYDPNTTLRKQAEAEQERRQDQQELKQTADELASHPQADTFMTEALGLLGEMVGGKLGGENGAETGKSIGRIIVAASSLFHSNASNAPLAENYYEKLREDQQKETAAKEKASTENKTTEPNHVPVAKNPNAFHPAPKEEEKEESTKENDSQETQDKGCCIS